MTTPVSPATTPRARSLLARSWAPYPVGIGIGLLSIFAFATADHGLGVSTPFEHAAGFVKQALDSTSGYFAKPDNAPKVDWEMMVVVGVVAGAWLASRGRASLPATPSSTSRLALAFGGGLLLMVGARLAGGCTSGHGITGALQLALSSWVFLPLIFVSGAVVARLLYGRTGVTHG